MISASRHNLLKQPSQHHQRQRQRHSKPKVKPNFHLTEPKPFAVFLGSYSVGIDHYYDASFSSDLIQVRDDSYDGTVIGIQYTPHHAIAVRLLAYSLIYEPSTDPYLRDNNDLLLAGTTVDGFKTEFLLGMRMGHPGWSVYTGLGIYYEQWSDYFDYQGSEIGGELLVGGGYRFENIALTATVGTLRDSSKQQKAAKQHYNYINDSSVTSVSLEIGYHF